LTTQFLSADTRWFETADGKPKLKSYPDPLTKAEPWTIGFGSTGADIGPYTVWTSEQCYARMTKDLVALNLQCSHFPWWDQIGDVRQDVFIQMGYQMGFAGLLKFTGTLAAAARGAWETVAADMKLSLWDKETPGRANRLAEQARTGVRVSEPYDTEVTQPALPTTEPTIMSVVSSLFHFVWNHTFAAAARAAATSDPTAAAGGIAVISTLSPPAAGGSPNSPAGVASGPIAALENDLNNMVSAFLKSTIDQIPVVGGLASATGLDVEASDAAKALLVLAEQHALTYLSALFSTAHGAVNAAVQGKNSA
jgi:lysozyme